jgi:hypothetical protein
MTLLDIGLTWASLACAALAVWLFLAGREPP